MRKNLFVIATFSFVLCLSLNLFSQEWEKLTRKKRPTFFEIQEAAYKIYGHRMDTQIPGFKQFKRWEWFAQYRLDKDGYQDPHLNWEGWLEKKLRFPRNAENRANWSSLGPFTQPNEALSLSGMGRLNCIAFDPFDPEILWVGAPTGGLWKTNDGGQTWTTTTDDLPNLGISDILIHPNNPDIMYIATGDKGRASALSVGVMKSQDGGQTWKFTDLNQDVTEKYIIGKLMMHPNDPDIILAATSQGVFKTIDGGANWDKKVEGDFYDLEVHPGNPKLWYASRSGNGVYRSSDSGKNWARLPNGLPDPSTDISRIAIAVATSSPGVIYAVYCQNIVSQGWEWGLYGIYSSTDGGDSWSLQASSPNVLGWDELGRDSGGQGGYALVFDVNPSNANIIYVGSVNLWKSIDGGITWQCITSFGNPNPIYANVHSDHHDLLFAPGSSTTIYNCNDGGLHRSADAGNTWTDLSSGLVIQQIYRLGLSFQDPNMMVIGAQDNGSAVKNGEWNEVSGGDGASCAIDPNNSRVIYTGWQFANFLRSIDDGRSFTQIFRNLSENRAWMAPLEMDPHDPSTLYTASNRVYRSIDRGSTHQPISPALSANPLTVIAIAPSNPDCIYVTDGWRLFKTSDGGSAWTELNIDVFPTIITDIAIHPDDHNLLWVSMGGYGRWNSRFSWYGIPYEVDKPKVFYSNTGGTSWADVSGILPNIPGNFLAIDPYSLGLYLGTDLGVFYSPTGQGGWERFDNNLPNVIVTEMEIHSSSGKIVAATYGRGIWESPLVSSPDVSGIYPPLHFSGSTNLNKSLSQIEYLNVLMWEENPLNANTALSHYRIYEIAGDRSIHIVDLDQSKFNYFHRYLEKRTYIYALVTVDREGRESTPLYLTLRR